MQLPNHSQTVTTAPKLKDFISFLEEKLDASIKLFQEFNEKKSREEGNKIKQLTDEHKSALNFVQTSLSWFFIYIMRSLQPIQRDILRLIPHLCSLDGIVIYDDVVKDQLAIVRSCIVARGIASDCSAYLIQQLKKVILFYFLVSGAFPNRVYRWMLKALEFDNWHSKLAAIQILQNFGVFNLFMINDQIKKEIQEMVHTHIANEQLEIRLACSNILSGFIHSNLIQVDDDLIVSLFIFQIFF